MWSFPLSNFLFDDDDSANSWSPYFYTQEPAYSRRRDQQRQIRDRPAAANASAANTNQQVATTASPRPQFGAWDMSTWTPRCDVRETDKEISLIAELPGMKPDDIQVHLENGLLTVSGERANSYEEGGDGGRWHHVERSFGSFSRSMRVPKNVTETDIRASYDNGILTVSFPNKAKQERDRTPKRIAVGGMQPASIESGSATTKHPVNVTAANQPTAASR